MDAAIHAGLDQRAEILVADRALVLLEAAAVEAVGHRLILQIALAALVADRAVERVIDSRNSITPLRAFCARSDLCGITMLSAAGIAQDAIGFGCLLLLDEAHRQLPAIRQPRMEAEMRDLDAEALTCLKHRRSWRHLDLLAVDRQLRHAPAPVPTPLSSPYHRHSGGSRKSIVPTTRSRRHGPRLSPG